MINKIFKQRMEDPPPLEGVARGVPSAFAAIVRKLMNKKPDERYQDCAELRADLARWTDPAARPRHPRGRGRGRPQLPAPAPGARRGRPPPPRSATSPSIRDAVSLRHLGDPEPSVAPRHQLPLPPICRRRPPVSLARSPSAPGLPPARRRRSAWLFQFAMVAIAVGHRRHHPDRDLLPLLSIGARFALDKAPARNKPGHVTVLDRGFRMSMIAISSQPASMRDAAAQNSGSCRSNDVVEINLLLPIAVGRRAHRAVPASGSRASASSFAR